MAEGICYTNRAVAEGRQRGVPCKLNNVKQTKHQSKDFSGDSGAESSGIEAKKNCEPSEDGKRNSDLSSRGRPRLFRYQNFESLILAQDERWRRA